VKPYGGREEERPARASQFWATARYRLTYDAFAAQITQQADYDIDEADLLWRKVARDIAAFVDLFDADEQGFLRNVMEQPKLLTPRQQRKLHWLWCETV
jgi:hypothetical protein